MTISTIFIIISNFRYNLAKANLTSVVKYGDTCQVEYKIQPKKEDSEFTDELLVVKKVYFGPKLEKPVRPAHNSSFSVYLSNRGVDETRFMQWVIFLFIINKIEKLSVKNSFFGKLIKVWIL